MQRRAIGRDWKLSARMFITMALLTGLYIAFLIFLSQSGVPTMGLIFIAALMLGAQYFFSDRLALFGMGAKVVTPAQEPELHSIVDRLAQTANIPKPRVAVSNMGVPNAFATGRSPSKAVVAVTRPLMEQLEPPELEAVLAHEVAHVMHRDVAIMTLASFFAMVAFFMMRSFLWMGMLGGGRRNSQGSMPLIVVWLVSMLVYFISQVLILALSRYREYAADRGAAQLTGQPSHLASALVKISGAVQRIPNKDLRTVEAMNAFFIVPTRLNELFSSHPPLEKRLRHLAEIQQRLEGR